LSACDLSPAKPEFKARGKQMVSIGGAAGSA
jgi:hypothetical protein